MAACFFSEEERARLERQFTELVHGGKAVRYYHIKIKFAMSI